MTRESLRRLRVEIAPFLNLGLFAGSLYAVDRVLTDYPLGDVSAALHEMPFTALAGALGTTALAYLALVAQDYVAFRVLGRPFAFRAVVLPSFISFAVSASAPGSMLTGGGVRYRLYRSEGISAAQATSVALVDAVTWLLGLLFLAGVLLVFRPLPAALAARVPSRTGPALGILFLLIVTGYLALAAFVRKPVRIRGLSIGASTIGLALAQLATSVADWVLASGTLFILLASVARVSYPDLLAAFFVAQAGSLILPVPGGLGVFEAAVLLLRPSGAAGPAILAALLAYRVVYYLLPLIAAGLLALHRELGRQTGAGVLKRLAGGLTSLAPHLLAGLTFVAGGLLFVTGAIPRDSARVAWLTGLMPPALIDVSQFLASVVGAALLVTAWGLERRIQLAYRAAAILFGWGILLALTRSMDLTVAIVLALVLSVILLAGQSFSQPASSLAEPMEPGWAFAVGAVLVVSTWLGLLSRRSSEVSGETWWRFTLFGSAPAYVRAAVGGGVALLLVTLVRFFHRNRPTSRNAARPG